MKKNFLISLIILAVLFIGIFLGYGFFKYSSKDNQNQPAKISQPVTNKSNTATEYWQVYINHKYGFQIKYPIGWNVKEYGKLSSFEIVRERKDVLDQFDVNFSTQNSQYNCFVTNKGSIKLGNYDWKIKVWEKGYTQGECKTIEKEFPKNKPVLYLSSEVNEKNIEIIIGNRTELDEKDKEVISTIKIFNPGFYDYDNRTD